jgi:hemolysin-activating ACP:hemolysin acyltransferase
MSIMSQTPARSPALRLFQHPNPAAALGLAVSHLMTKPAFARLPFGSWSRVLVGQINRKHYFLAIDPTGRIVGFLGWAITDEATAEAWLTGSGTPTGNDSGDCVIINAWSAETLAVNHLLLKGARQAGVGYRLVYFKRHYPNGSTRMGKLVAPDVMRSKLPALHIVPRTVT